MKRERIILNLTALVLVAVFGCAAYLYYLDQQSRTLLANRPPAPQVERYARIQKAFSARESNSIAPDEDENADRNPAPILPRDDIDTAAIQRAKNLMEERIETLRGNEAWSRIVEAFDRPRSTWSGEDWALLHTFLEENEALLDEIRALSLETGPMYPLDLSQGYATLLPHLAPIRQMARLLRASAAGRAQRGDFTGAAEDLTALLRIADRLEEEPLVISQLVRAAMDSIYVAALAESFPEGQIPPLLAAEMERAFDRHALADSLAAAWEVERSFGAGHIATIMNSGWQQGRQELSTLFEADDLPGGELGRFLYSSPLAKPWQYLDLQEFTRIMDESAELFGRPYYEVREELLDYERRVAVLPATRVITRNLLPSIHALHRAAARDQALRQLAQLGTALETYANEHGAYPPDLNAVGRTSIIDPFTGEPFRYSTNGDSFQLYSTGQNITDDGGHHNFHDGDIVWRGQEKSDLPRTKLAAKP